MGDCKIAKNSVFPSEIKARVADAIWANKPPMRLFNSIFEITETHLHRCYFNDAFKRYKMRRGKKIGSHGCLASGQVFRDLNRGYYEHMLVGIRRVVGGIDDKLVDTGGSKDTSTYSICAVLNSLAGLEPCITGENGFKISSLRLRYIGRRTSRYSRVVKMTKPIKRRSLIPGSICLIKRALLKDVKHLLEITNKHLAHLATDSSMNRSKAASVSKFHIIERDIELTLKRIVEVYDVLEHLFSPDNSHGLTRESPCALKSYEEFFAVPHIRDKSMTIRTALNLKIDAWRHGDLTSALTSRESFKRLSLMADACRNKTCPGYRPLLCKTPG